MGAEAIIGIVASIWNGLTPEDRSAVVAAAKAIPGLVDKVINGEPIDLKALKDLPTAAEIDASAGPKKV